ncbi:Uncharacterised protein [Shigella flexneri]|nr:Uncharacterised protein [Shigella flexneri]
MVCQLRENRLNSFVLLRRSHSVAGIEQFRRFSHAVDGVAFHCGFANLHCIGNDVCGAWRVLCDLSDISKTANRRR